MCLKHAGLLEHESDAAVAGGINVMLSAKTTAGICQLQALSVVGRCRTFEARCAERQPLHLQTATEPPSANRTPTF